MVLNELTSVKLLNSEASFSLKKLLSSSSNKRPLFFFNEFTLYNFRYYSYTLFFYLFLKFSSYIEPH